MPEDQNIPEDQKVDETNVPLHIEKEKINVHPDELLDRAVPGLYYHDEAIKLYFSDIKVPTKDSIKPLAVRIAGGDKTILFWKQDLRNKRISLPVMSINRTGWAYFPQKFAPPYAPMFKEFATKDGSKVKVTFRPRPLLVSYELLLWAERKRDIEHIMYDIDLRFNPLAEWEVDDHVVRGKVQAHSKGWTNNSDIQQDAEKLANVMYTLTIDAECWMSLPVKIAHSVLGKTVVLNEIDTREFLMSIDPRWEEYPNDKVDLLGRNFE